MKRKRPRPPRLGLGLPLIFITISILSLMVGLEINKRIYAVEKSNLAHTGALPGEKGPPLH
jgi:hypothetical protein